MVSGYYRKGVSRRGYPCECRSGWQVFEGTFQPGFGDNLKAVASGVILSDDPYRLCGEATLITPLFFSPI